MIDKRILEYIAQGKLEIGDAGFYCPDLACRNCIFWQPDTANLRPCLVGRTMDNHRSELKDHFPELFI